MFEVTADDDDVSLDLAGMQELAPALQAAEEMTYGELVDVD